MEELVVLIKKGVKIYLMYQAGCLVVGVLIMIAMFLFYSCERDRMTQEHANRVNKMNQEYCSRHSNSSFCR